MARIQYLVVMHSAHTQSRHKFGQDNNDIVQAPTVFTCYVSDSQNTVDGDLIHLYITA